PRDVPVARADALASADDQQDDVEIIGDRLFDALLHALRQRVDGLLPARQVDQYELGVVARPDAADAVASRVGHARDDRHLLTRERVHERRLADVRPAGDGDETGPQGSSQVSGRSCAGVLAWISPSAPR